MHDLAPIIVFVYNRPTHTRATIEALAKNTLAKDSQLFIYADGPKDDVSKEKVDDTRLYIDSLLDESFFKSVKIIKAERNLGLANSVIHGVSEVINTYGKVIVVEDDLVTTPDFLHYMNEALHFYENDSSIWSISGYSFKMRIPKSYKHDIFYSYRASSWGYATWVDRWNTVDWEISDYVDFKKNRKKRRLMNRGGIDMAHMLDCHFEGKIDSWAIRWCYAQSKQNKYTVYPVYSKVHNVGFDGSGTHTKKSKEHAIWDSAFASDFQPTKLERLQIDKRIARRFKARYGSWFMIAMRKISKPITLITKKLT